MILKEDYLNLTIKVMDLGLSHVEITIKWSLLMDKSDNSNY